MYLVRLREPPQPKTDWGVKGVAGLVNMMMIWLWLWIMIIRQFWQLSIINQLSIKYQLSTPTWWLKWWWSGNFENYQQQGDGHGRDHEPNWFATSEAEAATEALNDDTGDNNKLCYCYCDFLDERGSTRRRQRQPERHWEIGKALVILSHIYFSLDIFLCIIYPSWQFQNQFHFLLVFHNVPSPYIHAQYEHCSHQVLYLLY